MTIQKTENQKTEKTVFIAGKHLVADAPIDLPVGTAATPEFHNLYMVAEGVGKWHLRVHPKNFRVHLRIFGSAEIAICDDPQRVFIAGTQFWSEMDTYSVYVPELDVTVTAPHGYDVNIDDVAPAIKKLKDARTIIDSAKEGKPYGTIATDDDLRVLITVVSEHYVPDYTLFESPNNTYVTFAKCNRGDMGKIDGTGYQKYEFKGSFQRIMDLHHMWIYLRVLLGYEYPYTTVFNIGDSTVEWSGVPEDNDAE